jgi:para-aminobenzoate synthetase component 1
MSFYCLDFPYRTDASSYFAALVDLPWSAWLDSGGIDRYDILTASPHHSVELNDPHQSWTELLRTELGEQISPVEHVPFAGGVLGYWRYDLDRPADTRDAALCAGIYDWALVLDHQQQTARLLSHQRYPETALLLPQIAQRLRSGTALPADTFRVHGKISCNFTPASYAGAFATVQDYLQAGDCYQVNLAQRFSAHASGNALSAYLTLRSKSPAPYSAFLNFPKTQVLCASPERFISVFNKLVETKPIKGTRPRSSNAARDAQLADELRRHPKDRAENLMIVDLLRNDLGKNCQTGSVRVPKLFDIESYAHVHHLVSTVQGQLAANRDALDVLDGCFPGGSITGAPKLRAMQIIEQLEPDRRDLYCGSIAYIGFDGNMDSNIVIRTLQYSNGEIRCWAGGGLIADSLCDEEYQETFDKARAMLELLVQYGGEVDY